MAKRKKELPDRNQQNLGFDTIIYNNTRAIAKVVSNSMNRCKNLSRAQIASLLSGLMDKKVTETMLNHWASESHAHVIPADVVKPFCYITGSDELKRVLLTDDEVLAIGKDKKYLMLAKKQMKRDRLDAEIKELRDDVL